MITSDGWLDWAIRLPGPSSHTNNPNGFSPPNPAKGVFMHSAEGYASVLLDPNSQYGYAGNHSWHLTNVFNGVLYQHYPLTARCWHATAANNSYIGVENEGDYPKEPSLTNAQIATAQRFISEIATHYRWVPRRPLSSQDTLYTLWEHNEVVRLGGAPSACPSGRIPWDKILVQDEEEIMIRKNGLAAPNFWGDPSIPGSGLVFNGDQWFNVWGDFGLPSTAKLIRLDIQLDEGYVDVIDGDGSSFAGRIGGEASRRGQVDVLVNDSGHALVRGQGRFDFMGIVGYWNQ